MKMAVSGKASQVLPTLETLSLLGGRLCLDFTNTLDPRMGKEPHDLLVDYAALAQWSQRVGVLTENETHSLLSKAHLHAVETTMIWQRAIELREMMYRVFSSIANESDPQAGDVEALRKTYVDMMAHTQLLGSANGFTWNWVKSEEALDRMLWPIVRSAVDLLTSDEMKRVKQCPGLDDCGWLFLDSSKNGSRQWCSMEGCGSRAKMRQHYARKRANSKSQVD
jgi:predicted RNA-binding Zn ribbon-like protein